MTTEAQKIILVTGNPADGFRFIGPVAPDSNELETYIERYLQNECWWFVPLMNISDATTTHNQ